MKMLVEQLGRERPRGDRRLRRAPRVWRCRRPRACSKAEILSALDQLQAGGSTNGGAGIQLAYDVAVQNFIKGGTNRVILATDGDFNVGVTSDGDLTRLIEEKAQERRLPQRARLRHGQPQGHHDGEAGRQGQRQLRLHRHAEEARKVLVEQMGGTLVTIAKDVKIQVEFNPAQVGAVPADRLREPPAGQRRISTTTRRTPARSAPATRHGALRVGPARQGGDDPRRIGRRRPAQVSASQARTPVAADPAASNELMTVKLRFKAPDGDDEQADRAGSSTTGTTTRRPRPTSISPRSVAAFGMLLRDSPYKGNASYAGVLELAESSGGDDPSGYRHEFVELVRKARSIAGK